MTRTHHLANCIALLEPVMIRAREVDVEWIKRLSQARTRAEIDALEAEYARRNQEQDK